MVLETDTLLGSASEGRPYQGFYLQYCVLYVLIVWLEGVR